MEMDLAREAVYDSPSPPEVEYLIKKQNRKWKNRT